MEQTRSGSDSRWYLVFTQPHKEKRAASQLQNQGFGTFLPMHRKTIRHARQFREVIAPYFPRYLFVELSIARDRWLSVNGTFGVTNLVMQGDRPVPVPLGVVEALAVFTDEDGLLSTEGSLRRDDAVRIATGPFSGLVGELETLEQDGRVKVLLDLMGTKRRVSVLAQGLVPID